VEEAATLPPPPPAHEELVPTSADCKAAPERPTTTVDDTPLASLGFRDGAPMRGHRYDHASVVVRGRLFVFGGNGSDAFSHKDQNLVEEYDVHADSWTTVGTMTGGRARAVRLNDDKVLVVTAGYAGIFDPETYTWKAAAGVGKTPTALLSLDDDRVLADFGNAPPRIWSRSTDTWSPLDVGATYHANATRLTDGRVLFTNSGSTQITLWGTSVDHFMDGNLPLQAGGAVEPLEDGRALLVGASDSSDPGFKKSPNYKFVSTPLMVFDPAGKHCVTTWVPRTLIKPSTVRLPSGKVLLVDGYTQMYTSAYTLPNAIVVVDPSTGDAKPYAPLDPLFPNVDVVDGKVVVTGGTVDCGHGCTNPSQSGTWVLDTPP
jgi:hypothetical protein